MTAIDGSPIASMDIDEVATKLRGTAGTIVNISVLRGKERLSFQVMRTQFVIKNVSYSLSDSKVGVIRLKGFRGATSCDEVGAAIRSLETQGAKSLVLDLRDNGGGSAEIGACIAGLFIGGDKLLFQLRYAEVGKEPKNFWTTGSKATSLPLILWVILPRKSGHVLVDYAA